MSLLLNTIKSFPNGRSLEELFILLDCAFDQAKRTSIQIELDEFLQNGEVYKGSDGKWRPVVKQVLNPSDDQRSSSISNGAENKVGIDNQILFAAPAVFHSEEIPREIDEEIIQGGPPDPNALLRYWRSALRADPRGATTQVEDRHGVSWHLLSGKGPIAPSEEEVRKLSIKLDDLSPEFRQALLKREANENAFAIGWPIAVGRKTGIPSIWPVGLLSAEWRRTESTLEIKIEADDILVNPDWLNGAAKSTGWRVNELKEIFEASSTVGLQSDLFLTNLREAAAGHIRGRLTGENLLTQVDMQAAGVYDIAAIFLPNDSSFTAGAARDLDAIASWPRERLSRTALAPVLGLEQDIEEVTISNINPGPLNLEQIQAVANSCSSPFSVVTGPPGTGKSQAIVSMVASVLASGGSVLVASKNHQALDAVEDRLKGLSPSTSFLVRTLDPNRDIDISLTDVLKELITAISVNVSEHDEVHKVKIRKMSHRRARSIAAHTRIIEIECQIAERIERIIARQEIEGAEEENLEKNVSKPSLLTIILQWILSYLTDRKLMDQEAKNSTNYFEDGVPTTLLKAELEKLRFQRTEIDQPEDLVKITEEIAELTRDLLPRILSSRSSVPEEVRISIANQKDELEFSAANAPLPGDLARIIISHRPLWLASVLGTPKRLPLDDGLFDLVIFDEASQCDIASALPLFARAKRAVVVGDDRQLTFIPQIGQAQDKNLMQAQGLPIGKMARYAQSKRSLFDLALRISETPRVLLRQQYRSAGPIVDYISSEYYGGRLATAYDPSGLVVPKKQKPGLAWNHVPGPIVPENGNVNSNEANAISNHLKKLLVEESYQGTIGVISPFRPQVNMLEEKIRSSLPEHKLVGAEFRVATVDGFQGQERDLIIISPCLGATSTTSALIFLQKDLRRLNVAISRARAVAHIFGDLDYARSGKISALAKLAAVATEQTKRSGEGVFDSEWERRVFHALKERGLDPRPQYEIAGRRLDFALFGSDDLKLDLEVDGRRWHQDADGKRKVSDLWRDHQLKSMGWRVRRFWVDELAKNMEACLDLVERDLS